MVFSSLPFWKSFYCTFSSFLYLCLHFYIQSLFSFFSFLQADLSSATSFFLSFFLSFFSEANLSSTTSLLFNSSFPFLFPWVQIWLLLSKSASSYYFPFFLFLKANLLFYNFSFFFHFLLLFCLLLLPFLSSFSRHSPTDQFFCKLVFSFHCFCFSCSFFSLYQISPSLIYLPFLSFIHLLLFIHSLFSLNFHCLYTYFSFFIFLSFLFFIYFSFYLFHFFSNSFAFFLLFIFFPFLLHGPCFPFFPLLSLFFCSLFHFSFLSFFIVLPWFSFFFYFPPVLHFFFFSSSFFPLSFFFLFFLFHFFLSSSLFLFYFLLCNSFFAFFFSFLLYTICLSFSFFSKLISYFPLHTLSHPHLLKLLPLSHFLFSFLPLPPAAVDSHRLSNICFPCIDLCGFYYAIWHTHCSLEPLNPPSASPPCHLQHPIDTRHLICAFHASFKWKFLWHLFAFEEILRQKLIDMLLSFVCGWFLSEGVGRQGEYRSSQIWWDYPYCLHHPFRKEQKQNRNSRWLVWWWWGGGVILFFKQFWERGSFSVFVNSEREEVGFFFLFLICHFRKL